jgi:oligopeptide/dipeptide ABC transporter ATP-binding protein
MSEPLLAVENLCVTFASEHGAHAAVSQVSFSLRAGEALGVVGESGSGKSLTMLSLLQLLPNGASAAATRAQLGERELLRLSRDQLNSVRGREIAIVFQDPLTALNPVLSIGRQITEVLRHHFNLEPAPARLRAVELLTRVGIPDPALRMNQYPHEFSGGMRQRVTIAMALAGAPKVLIADEPTTALDVTVQAQIVSLIADLLQQTGMGVIWVTHDLALLARIADRVLVMFAGRIMESATCEELFTRPQHPYTQSLLSTLREGRTATIGGEAPMVSHADPAPVGCPFAPRCAWVMDICRATVPVMTPAAHGGQVACWKVTR